MSLNGDNGPMWSQDENGAYWLLFPNKHALARDNIKKIFSQFGTIQNFTMAGDEKGLRFVQYSSLEEVERAVENLKNHPTVRLVPYRPKKKNNINPNDVQNNGQSNNNANNKLTTINHEKKNLYQRKSLGNRNESNDSIESQFQNSMFNRESVHTRKNLDNWSNNENASMHLSLSNKSSCYKFGSTLQLSKNALINQLSYTSAINSRSLSNLNECNRAQNLIKLRGLETDSFSNNGLYNNGIINDDEIPELVTKANSYKQSKKVILNAEEVVVANIHTNYGSSYIIHLFERYEPLAVSNMKILPNSDIRYCHVYFKSARESLKVETEFDKFNLSGKNLIVLRPCTLMEESMN